MKESKVVIEGQMESSKINFRLQHVKPVKEKEKKTYLSKLLKRTKKESEN